MVSLMEWAFRLYFIHSYKSNNMILKILLGFAAVLGLLWSIKFGNKKSILITAGLVFSISFIFIPVPSLKSIGMIIYMIFSMSALIYGLTNTGLTVYERIIVCLITFPIFIYWFFALNHLPGLNILRVIMIVPFVSFIIGLGLKHVIKAEIGFLLIFVMDAITMIMESWIIKC